MVDKPVNQDCFNVGLSYANMSTWLERTSWRRRRRNAVLVTIQQAPLKLRHYGAIKIYILLLLLLKTVQNGWALLSSSFLKQCPANCSRLKQSVKLVCGKEPY